MSARDVIADCLHDTSLDRMSTCLRRSNTILSALRSAGWAVVPVEPTEDMRVRFKEQTGSDAHDFAASMYKAMLKAAQEDSRER